MTLYDWCRTIAFALNDDEPGLPFQRYPISGMIDAYNAAMCIVGDYRADLFTELRIVRLASGKHQDVRGCCMNVLGVVDQTDAVGNIVRELGGRSGKKPRLADRNWTRAVCLRDDDAGYLIDYTEIDPALNGRFTVHPPVPCDTEAYVMVKCVNKPCSMSVAEQNAVIEADCSHTTAAWHYVLARMLSGDRFSNAAGGNADYHYKMFFELLGIQQKLEEYAEINKEVKTDAVQR
jgi:hypothetical protein